MNKDNAAQYLPLVQALADGKVIQWKNSLGWHDIESPGFEGDIDRYRIKPEPREWWAVITPKGSVWATYCLEVFAKNCAEATGYQVVHVREVIP